MCAVEFEEIRKVVRGTCSVAARTKAQTEMVERQGEAGAWSARWPATRPLGHLDPPPKRALPQRSLEAQGAGASTTTSARGGSDSYAVTVCNNPAIRAAHDRHCHRHRALLWRVLAQQRNRVTRAGVALHVIASSCLAS